MRKEGKKLPSWLRKRLPEREKLSRVRNMLSDLELATVCQEARCPNLCECFAHGTATFMILGDICSRNCSFCAVKNGEPDPPPEDEPERVARAVEELNLRYVVITSVTRDDLPDGGSEQFAETINAVRKKVDAGIEVLTPDFGGNEKNIDRVLEASPEVYNHNVETVPRLYESVRPQADYRRSLKVLKRASEAGVTAKSGLMLGMGEREDEIVSVLEDLLEAECRVLTMGQYLAPSGEHYEVRKFYPPEEFERLRDIAYKMGFVSVASGPFVRSSYHAGEVAENINP